jgi:hypothetical protein
MTKRLFHCKLRKRFNVTKVAIHMQAGPTCERNRSSSYTALLFHLLALYMSTLYQIVRVSMFVVLSTPRYASTSSITEHA